MLEAGDRPRRGGGPLRRHRLGDEVTRYIREGLINGTYHAGERLGVQALAEEFGVSTMPIREALVALFAPSGYFNVTRFGLFVMSVNGHGWWNLIAAVLFIATAAALLGGATWARVVAVILAALSAIEQLLLIPAQPWWSFIVIAIDVLIIYAVTAHGREISS